ncbi:MULTISPECIES: ABC transporter ATP-binding protein [unclassified Luteococcus]|uniref:ABC transporter ATP-binding protein n=1 Tax=unclassified Luteococcus TaxID=2639923 RepID=UPI00313B8CDF
MNTSTAMAMSSRLEARRVSLGYEGEPVVDGLDLAIPDGEFTAIIGPNACGKSTVLKGLARLLAPSVGEVLLDGRAIAQQSTADVARRLGLLPQGGSVPDGIRVVDLVARGRFAHQRFLRRWSEADASAVDRAMADARVAGLADRVVDELSGGQRQRVWLALVLAQQTPLLLLDEPTTYLDVNHQLEVLDLCARLRREGRTVVAVLHDLNQAIRYATHLVAMRDGRIVMAGSPEEVVTAELLREVFRIEALVLDDPTSGGPLVVPVRPLSGEA